MSIDKLRKALQKKDKYNLTFSPIQGWISTGNMALNSVISGDMQKGIPVSRSTIISGLSGTGKSFLVSNIAKNAQKDGFTVIYCDTENSVGDEFMTKIGVDLSEDKFQPMSLYSIDQFMEFFSDILKNTEKDEKILLVVDSLSNLEPEGDIKKNEEGRVAYGQGLKEKLFKQLVRNVNSKCGDRSMAAVFIAHEYVNGSDTYGNPILVPSVGKGTIFIPSIGLSLTKKDLKEGKEQVGISVVCKTFKTRYTSLGKKCEFALPWDRGMDELDGVIGILEDEGIITRSGAWYSYTLDGEVKKFQSRNLKDHIDVLLPLYTANVGEIVEMENDEEVDLEA